MSKWMDEAGRFEVLGGLRGPDLEVDQYAEGPVPHLQRTGPDGRWLMTWDGWRRRLILRDTQVSGAARHLTVAGLGGHVSHLRWLHDQSGAVFVTDRNAFVVRFALDGPTSAQERAWAHPVFGVRPGLGRPDVYDVRPLAGGLIASTSSMDDGTLDTAAATGRSIWFVGITAHRVAAPRRILDADDRAITGMTVLRGNRVAVSRTATGRSVIQIVRVTRTGTVAPLEVRPCADRDYCDVSNWSPNTRRLAYVLADGRVVLSPGGDAEDVVIDPHYEETPVHTLWLSPDERRVLVAQGDEVRVYDFDGEELWTWNSGEDDVHSARFDTDGRRVLVTSGRRALRLTEGTARVLFRARRPAPRPRPVADASQKPWSEVFVDHLVPLSEDRFAYQVVSATLYTRWDEPSLEEEEEE